MVRTVPVKTTTLKIETLREVDGGTALINGVDVVQKPKDVRRVIGVHKQTTGFYDIK